MSSLVVGLCLAFSDVAFDSWDERDPADKVADTDGDKCKTDLDGSEAPLLVNDGKRLNKHEDEGVGETREKRQSQDNGLGEEHLEWSTPSDQDLLGGEAIPEWNKLVRTVDVCIDTRLAPLLGNVVHHDCTPSFGYDDQMKNLDESSKDELNPDTPSPVEKFLTETTNDWTKNGSTDGREDDKCNGVLLFIRLPHVCNHTESDGTTSRRETTQSSADHNGSKVRGECDRELPNVNQQQTEL